MILRLRQKIFLTHFLILYWSLKFICLGSKTIQIIIFILSTLAECSMRIQNKKDSFNDFGA